MTGIVDAHHHIWRQADLPWLSGPMQPRIFGPYEPIRRDYPIEEYLADLAGTGVTTSVYVQTNWAKDRFEDEVAWVQRDRRASTAGRMPSSPMPISRVDDVRPQLDRLTQLSARARRAHAAALARKPALPLRRAARSLRRSDDPAQRRAARRLRLELRPAGVRAADGRTPRDLAEACPKVTFVLQHAGMLEDLSPRRARRMARRHDAARRAARTSSPSFRGSAPSSIATTRRISRRRARDGRDLRRGALPVRLELSDREAVDQLSRARRRAIAPQRPLDAPSSATRSCMTTAMRVYRLCE